MTTHKLLQTLCVLLFFCLSAAGVSAAPFVSRHGYSVTPPPGWIVHPGRTGGDDVVIDYTKNLAADGAPNFRVNLSPVASSVTLEALKPFVLARYARKFPGLVIKSQTFSALGGVRDLDLVLLQPRHGILLRFRQVYVLKNGFAYIFSAAYLEKAHARYDPVLAQMLASVRWK